MPSECPTQTFDTWPKSLNAQMPSTSEPIPTNPFSFDLRLGFQICAHVPVYVCVHACFVWVCEHMHVYMYRQIGLCCGHGATLPLHRNHLFVILCWDLDLTRLQGVCHWCGGVLGGGGLWWGAGINRNGSGETGIDRNVGPWGLHTNVGPRGWHWHVGKLVLQRASGILSIHMHVHVCLCM